MIVAITGGTGFIGKKLTQFHLALGDEVRILSRAIPDGQKHHQGLVKFYQADLASPTDLISLSKFASGADVLYHCAAEIKDAARMAPLHIAGTQRLVNVATGKIGRWVQLSTTGAYGPRRNGVVTEKTDLNPQGPYEETKVASDRLVSEASLNGAFQHVVLRPSNVYGAMMPNRSLYSLISMINRGLFFFLGKPGGIANYIHVDNVVEALVLCGKMPQADGKIYNLSDFRTIEQFVTIIAGLLNKQAPCARLPEFPMRVIALLFGKIPGFPLTLGRVDALTSRSIYSTAKIEQELGYRNRQTMESGLADLVHFWELHIKPYA